MLSRILPARARTLRVQLVIWNAAVVILTAMTTLVIVREGVRLSLLDEMDQMLTEDLSEIRLAILDSQNPDLSDLKPTLDRRAQGHSQHGWFVQLLDAGHTIFFASRNSPVQLPELTGDNDSHPISYEGVRLVSDEQNFPGRGRITVRVGASLDFLQKDMRRIDRLTLIGAGAVLILAPLAGFILAARATRPLNEIIETTARLRPSELKERLKIRNTGDELDRLSNTINGLLDRIAVYLNLRRDFIANAAHELRTPLAAIRSSVEVAMNSDRSPEEYAELLSELIEECQSLETLVNQLLLLAESDADRLRIHAERVSLSEIVQKAVDMFRGVAESRDVRLDSEILPQIIVEGNRPHLRQVLNNLIDNALKFTPTGGKVFVRLQHNPMTDLVVLDVQDSGCGIPPHDLPHVFDRFYRGDKARQREGIQRGTGLGLSICRAIIEAHGGTITAHSEPGSGSLFRLTMRSAVAETNPELLGLNSLAAATP